MSMIKNRSLATRLEPNHEIIGILHAVQDGDNCCRLEFTCSKEIELPPTAIPQEKLISLVGKRIGVLNIDGQFFLREI